MEQTIQKRRKASKLTQFNDVWRRRVPAAFSARRHSNIVDVSWREGQARPHHVTGHLEQ